ncbi:hypothetical protein HZC27_01615 [Candidatus Roizmanbacteria bacterium]|nr:hypothetical protein [Candidatus Roizmanbacteria bacterium]
MLPTLKRLSLVFIIVLSLAFFGYLVYTGMGAKTKASISSNVAGNGEVPFSTDGLLAVWNFNETNGTMARSEGSCGKQCDGQLVNFAYTGSQDAALGTGWTAKNKLWGTGALMFDGVNDEVKVNNFQLLNANFTYEAWIKIEGGTGIESFGTLGPDPTHTWNFAYDMKNKRWDLWDKSNGSWYTNHDIGPAWHHVAVVYDGPTQYLYVDGTLKNSRSITSPIADGGGRTLQIGNTPNPQPLNGILDAVRIYSRALTDKEIFANFQAQNGPTPIQQSLTATPVPSGTPDASGIIFKVLMPDVSQAVGTVKDVKVLITSKPGTLYDFTVDLQRVQGTDFFIANPIELDIPDGSYIFNIKQAKSLSRTFTVHLSKGKTLDCSRKDSDVSCESLGKPELAPLYSGDSDGLIDTKINNGVRANSYNVVDSADLQKVVAGYGATSLPPEPNGDFNLDGKIDVQDLGILGKNFGKRGD